MLHGPLELTVGVRNPLTGQTVTSPPAVYPPRPTRNYPPGGETRPKGVTQRGKDLQRGSCFYPPHDLGVSSEVSEITGQELAA